MIAGFLSVCMDSSGQNDSLKTYSYSYALNLVNRYKNDSAQIKKLNCALNHEIKIIRKNQCDSLLKKNPFLPIEGELKSDNKDDKGNEDKGNEDNKQNSPTHIYSWQSSVINGLAGFMAVRFKEEVQQTAAGRIFSEIDNNELVKFIFPNTYKLAHTYRNSSNVLFSSDLSLLREATQIDIQNLSRTLPEALIEYPDSVFFPFMKNKPKVKEIFLLAKNITKFSLQSKPLKDLFSELSNCFADSTSLCQSLKLANLLVQALLDEKNDSLLWVPKNVPKNELTLEETVFYALLFEQLRQVPVYDSIFGKDEIDTTTFINRIETLTAFAGNLNKAYKTLRTKKFNLEKKEDYIDYLKTIKQIVSLFLKEPLIKKYCNLDDDLFEIIEQYISLIELVTVDLENEKGLQKIQKIIPRLTIFLINYLNLDIKSVRTLTFVSQLALIEKEADMVNLLESYTLPIGSSSIKRNSRFNVTLNSYVGLTAGHEMIIGQSCCPRINNFGLTAPVGLAFTFGCGKVTAFASFIDLGSIVNVRLKSDTTFYSKIKFEHFFTPGIGLYFNCPKNPITIGLHYCYVPKLRTVNYLPDAEKVEIVEKSYDVSRINASILVDIPFFTIYNRSHKRKF